MGYAWRARTHEQNHIPHPQPYVDPVRGKHDDGLRNPASCVSQAGSEQERRLEQTAQPDHT